MHFNQIYTMSSGLHSVTLPLGLAARSAQNFKYQLVIMDGNYQGSIKDRSSFFDK